MINSIDKESERASTDKSPVEPGGSRYPGVLGEPGTQRPKRDQETERTVFTRGRAKETDVSEIRDPPNVQTVRGLPRTIRMRQTTREPGDSAKPGGLRELGGIGETGRTRVPTVRRVRKSEICNIPRIAMWLTTSDDM